MRDFTNSQKMVEVPAINIMNWDCGKETFPEMGWDNATPTNASAPNPKDGETDFLDDLVEEAGIEAGTDVETAKAQMARHVVLKSRQMGQTTLNQNYLKLLNGCGMGDAIKVINPIKYLPPPKFVRTPDYYKWAEKRYEDNKLTMKFEDGKWVDK